MLAVRALVRCWRCGALRHGCRNALSVACSLERLDLGAERQRGAEGTVQHGGLGETRS
jgi:hypothetical protein